MLFILTKVWMEAILSQNSYPPPLYYNGCIVNTFIINFRKTMKNKKETKVVLVLKDVEECDMILYGLDQVQRTTQNVNMEKLNQLKGIIQVIKISVKNKFARL